MKPRLKRSGRRPCTSSILAVTSRACDAMSPAEVLTVVRQLRRHSPEHEGSVGEWSEEADTVRILESWQDAEALSLQEVWVDFHTLSPHLYLTRPSRSRHDFLTRWRDRWRGTGTTVLVALVAFTVLLATHAACAQPTASPAPAGAASPAPAGAASPAPAAVDTNAALFEEAGKASRAGQWEEAASDFRELVKRGVNDATVWYDLGNVCSRLDDPGRARAAYEHALLLTPRDPDLRANLARLRARLVDQEPDEDALMHLVRLFTVNELAVVTAVTWWLVAIATAAWIRARRSGARGGAGVAATVCLLAFLVSGGMLTMARRNARDEAVVIPGSVRLHNGPSRDDAAGIDLHAGTRVQVLGTSGDWREVGAFDRVRGWLRSEEIEQI